PAATGRLPFYSVLPTPPARREAGVAPWWEAVTAPVRTDPRVMRAIRKPASPGGTRLRRRRLFEQAGAVRFEVLAAEGVFVAQGLDGLDRGHHLLVAHVEDRAVDADARAH